MTGIVIKLEKANTKDAEQRRAVLASIARHDPLLVVLLLDNLVGFMRKLNQQIDSVDAGAGLREVLGTDVTEWVHDAVERANKTMFIGESYLQRDELRLDDDDEQRHKLWRLARTFPSLRSGLERFPMDESDFKWDAFAEWARGAWATGGSMRSARFIAHVWTGSVQPDNVAPFDPFNLVDAMGSWDHGHRRAFLAWAQNPWWC